VSQRGRHSVACPDQSRYTSRLTCPTESRKRTPRPTLQCSGWTRISQTIPRTPPSMHIEDPGMRTSQLMHIEDPNDDYTLACTKKSRARMPLVQYGST